MILYEFYRRGSDWESEDRLIGVLPERRKDPERITYQAIMNWVKWLVPPEDILKSRIYFVRIEYPDQSSPPQPHNPGPA